MKCTLVVCWWLRTASVTRGLVQKGGKLWPVKTDGPTHCYAAVSKAMDGFVRVDESREEHQMQVMNFFHLCQCDFTPDGILGWPAVSFCFGWQLTSRAWWHQPGSTYVSGLVSANGLSYSYTYWCQCEYSYFHPCLTLAKGLYLGVINFVTFRQVIACLLLWRWCSNVSETSPIPSEMLLTLYS